MSARYDQPDSSWLGTLSSPIANHDPFSSPSNAPLPQQQISRIRPDLLKIMKSHGMKYQMRRIDKAVTDLTSKTDPFGRWLGRTILKNLAEDREEFEVLLQNVQNKCNERRRALRTIDIVYNLPLVPEIASMPITLSADDLVDLLAHSSVADNSNLQAIDIRYYASAGKKRGETFVVVYNVPGDRLVTGKASTMYVCIAYEEDLNFKRAVDYIRRSERDHGYDKSGSDTRDDPFTVAEWMFLLPRITIYLVDQDDTPTSLETRHITLHRLTPHRPNMTFGYLATVMQSYQQDFTIDRRGRRHRGRRKGVFLRLCYTSPPTLYRSAQRLF